MAGHMLVALVTILDLGVLLWFVLSERSVDHERLPDEEVLRRLEETLED